MKNQCINQCFSISCWNINGLEYKSHGIKYNKLYDPEVIECLKNYDCIGLLETHADKLVDISMRGYYVFRKDRPKNKNARTPSGGIAVLVKESMRHVYKFDPISDSDVIWICIKREFTSMVNDLYIAFVYLPPLNSSYGRINSKEIMQKLEKQIEYFSCKGKIFICGDLNARIGDYVDIIQKEEEPYLPTPPDDTFEIVLPRVSHDKSVVNQSGRWLIDRCVDNQLYILNGRTLGDLTGRYTCHTPRGSSTVDYFIASRSLSHFIHSMKVHDLSILSDHCLISVNLKLHSQHSYVEERSSSEDNTPCFAPDRFVWSECSKSKYNEVFTSSIIQRKISYINAITESNITDVDILIDNISDVIVSAGDMTLLRKSVKAKKKRVRKVDKKWYDRDCHKVYKELKTMKNAFNRNTSNTSIRSQFYKKFKEYKRLTKYKRRKYKERLTSLLNDAMEKDPQAAWKIIDELKNDSVPSEKSERINRRDWYNHFYKLLHNDTNEVGDEIKTSVKNDLSMYEKQCQTSNLDYQISEKEIFAACKKLKNNKASAYDLIRNEMIKAALPHICKPVMKAFNVILNSGHFPKSWRDGIIVPVYKHGSHLDASNYRGITLSSCLGKLFCHIINNRISSELERRNFLNPEQTGFRKNHRTSDHLYVLKTIIDKYVLGSKNGSKIFACFIDLKKAFDTVWHDGLFLKLQKAGICGKVYNIIKSMYSCSHSRIKCKNTMSDPIEITKGVHQGNVLSPLLFNVFINDIGDNFSVRDVPVIHNSNVSHLLYADDLLLLATDEHTLQQNIEKVHEFCNRWGLSVNADKSKIMIFTKNGQVAKDRYRFKIGQICLEQVSSYKYLGVDISSSGKFSLAEKNLSLKASRALFSVKQSIFNNSIKPSVVLRIFNALVKPIALYNSEVWIGYKSCYQNKTIDEMFEMSLKSFNDFDKIVTRFSKFVLGVHSKASNFAVFSELGQFPLIISEIASCVNFWLHVVKSSDNSLLSKAYLEQYNSSGVKYIWVRFVKTVLIDLGFSHVWENQCSFNSSALISCIKNKLKERYLLFWEKSIQSVNGMNKLRTYKLFKNSFSLQNYLEVLTDIKQRKVISAFRISAHNLKIERDRYLGKKVEERLCTSCNEIEDEIHLLCDCVKYQSFRDEMYQVIFDDDAFKRKTNIENFTYIMTSTENKVLKAVGKFLLKCDVC